MAESNQIHSISTTKKKRNEKKIINFLDRTKEISS